MAIDVYLQIDGIKGDPPMPPIRAGSKLHQHNGVSYNHEVRRHPRLEDIQPNGASIRALR